MSDALENNLPTIDIESIIYYQKGYAFSSSEYEEGGHPIVRVKDFNKDSVKTETEKTISSSSAKQYKRFTLKAKDILISTVGSWPSNPNSIVGKTVIVPDELEGALLNQNIVRLRSKKPLSQLFLFYALKDKNFSNHVISCARGSANQASITLKDIFQYRIIDLDPKEHFRIAEILYSLDKKIELNRKINKNLEEIAKALFKSWFIDFDPVKAKEDHSTELPDEISNLFPNSFEDSELGKIPKGWSTNSIYKISKVLYGAPFSSKLFNTKGKGIPLARIRDLKTGNPGVWTEEIHPKGCLIEPGDIVVGMDGEFRTYLWGNQRCWMNQRICKFIPNEKFNNCFLRYSISKPLYMIEISETATTVIHLGKSDIDAFRIIYPSSEILDLFGKISKPIEQSIIRNKQESTTLNLLKNILIPKLISGELIIPDAEKMIEELGI